MNLAAHVASAVDDFIAGAGPSDAAQRLQRIGTVLGVPGVTATIGVLVFLAVVYRGGAAGRRRLGRLATVTGGITVVGAAIEVAAIASIHGVSWIDALTGDAGAAAMMRFGGGALVVLGLVDTTLGRDGSAGEHDSGHDVGHNSGAWSPTAFFAVAGAVIAALSFVFDGHTVSKGPRIVHALVDVVHVGAGGVWFGGILALVAVARADTWKAMLQRFSLLATVSLAAVAGAGVLMALFVIDGVGDLTGTPWGRLLLVKVGLVAITAAVGAYNHFVVVGTARSGDPAGSGRGRVAVTVEATLLVAVVVVTGFLTTASPN